MKNDDIFPLLPQIDNSSKNSKLPRIRQPNCNYSKNHIKPNLIVSGNSVFTHNSAAMNPCVSSQFASIQNPQEHSYVPNLPAATRPQCYVLRNMRHIPPPTAKLETAFNLELAKKQIHLLEKQTRKRKPSFQYEPPNQEGKTHSNLFLTPMSTIC